MFLFKEWTVVGPATATVPGVAAATLRQAGIVIGTVRLNVANNETGQAYAQALVNALNAQPFADLYWAELSVVTDANHVTIRVYGRDHDISTIGTGNITLLTNPAAGLTVGAGVATLAPPPAPTLAAVVSGALGALHYDGRATYVTANGETALSPATLDFAVAANSVPKMTSPPAAVGAIGWFPYLALAGGTVTRQKTGAAVPIGTDFQLPPTGLIVGAAAPGASTAGPFQDTGSLIVPPVQPAPVSVRDDATLPLLPLTTTVPGPEPGHPTFPVDEPPTFIQDEVTALKTGPWGDTYLYAGRRYAFNPVDTAALRAAGLVE